MTNTGRYEFVDCMRLALFGDGCSAAVLTAENVKPGDNKWVIEGNQYFSNQTSITIKEARFLEILVFKNNELVNYDRFIQCFVFWSKQSKTKKLAVLFVYFLYKKSAFCLKMKADFFPFFGQLTM